MPQISRTALVPFSAEQMYQLVNDVKSYPDFLPGCTGSRVLELGPTQMTAAVDVSKAGISKDLHHTQYTDQQPEHFDEPGGWPVQEADWRLEVYSAEPRGLQKSNSISILSLLIN